MCSAFCSFRSAAQRSDLWHNGSELEAGCNRYLTTSPEPASSGSNRNWSAGAVSIAPGRMTLSSLACGEHVKLLRQTRPRSLRAARYFNEPFRRSTPWLPDHVKSTSVCRKVPFVCRTEASKPKCRSDFAVRHRGSFMSGKVCPIWGTDGTHAKRLTASLQVRRYIMSCEEDATAAQESLSLPSPSACWGRG